MMSVNQNDYKSKKRKHEETHKELHYIDPPTLKQEHLQILLKCLNGTDEMELKVLIDDSSFPKLYQDNVLQPFQKWRSLLCIGEDKVSHNPPHPNILIRGTFKILLPEHRHLEAINQAHRGVKMFTGMYSRDKNKNIRHNSMEKTLYLLRNRYAVGKNEFGIPLDTIMNFVAFCSECIAVAAQQPTDQIVVQQKIADRKDISQIVAGFLYASPQPPSMLWNQNKMSRQIWYGKKELSKESDIYKKLLLVIKDIKYEIGKALNKSDEANYVLNKKLNAALKMVSFLKNKNPKEFIQSVEESEIMKFLDHLCDNVDVDTFLFDVQGLSRSCEFWEKVSLEKLTEMKEEIQGRQDFLKEYRRSNSIDFDAPITLSQKDISAIKLPDGSLGNLGHLPGEFNFNQNAATKYNQGEILPQSQTTSAMQLQDTHHSQVEVPLSEMKRFDQGQLPSALQLTTDAVDEMQSSVIGKLGQHHSTSPLELKDTLPPQEVAEVLSSIIDQIDSLPLISSTMLPKGTNCKEARSDLH